MWPASCELKIARQEDLCNLCHQEQMRDTNVEKEHESSKRRYAIPFFNTGIKI